MACPELANALPRISARRGQVVDLNVDFYNSGKPTDPFAIYKVEIYKTQILPHNLVATIPIAEPTDALYPAPLCRDEIEDPTGACGTEPSASGVYKPGKYHLPYLVPVDSVVPDIYFDLWYYFPTNPVENGTSPTADELDDVEVQAQLLKCCHRFWVYPENWFCQDGLQTVRFDFEPLDNKFNSPEKRPMEVGIIPLPLYDFNYNLVVPLIPFLQPTITIMTQNHEVLVDKEECRIGIRQGSYRTHPWVVQYDLDTTRFLKGTYWYFLTLALPDGSTRVSKKFIVTIA
jgi:hypothetical protein